MQATPHSSERYFPMLLSNGNDAVLMNYSGSMFSGGDAHAHREQYQGCPCGWYKVSQVRYAPEAWLVQPILRTGYLIFLEEEAWDICDYHQEFDPATATLTTDVTAGGVRCRIQAFLTDDGILVEHYRILKAPTGKRVRMVFTIHEPQSGMVAVNLWQKTDLKNTVTKDRRVAIDYRLAGQTGAGIMLSDRKPDATQVYHQVAYGLCFDKVRTGWTATKYVTLADTSDDPNYKARIKSIQRRCVGEGWAGIRKSHVKRWSDYFIKSHVTLPDEKFQYLYDLSLYMMRAHQHPQTGGINCGMLPHLWGGGIYVPYDAFFDHQALLLTNHCLEAHHHLDFYRRQRPAMKALCRKLGLAGVAYSGWSNCRGEHRRANFATYLLNEKPMMQAFIILKFYWHWRYDPEGACDLETLALMREILDLAVDRLIADRGSFAVLKACKAGNESAIDVENDTFTAIIYARALVGYGDMAASMGQDGAKYAELGKKLYKGLKGNYRKGILQLFPNAQYLGPLQPDFFSFNLPDGIDRKNIDQSIKATKNTWGLTTDQPEQGYQHWPWHASKASICYTHLGDAHESFHWLQHSIKYTSSLGAIPEKIRIDGFPIGFWYTSPHALLVWATVAAIVHDGKNKELGLLWGLDGQWKDLVFKDIRLVDGLLVSGKVKKGQLTELRIKNTSSRNVERTLTLNPCYKGTIPDRVTLPAGKTLQFVKKG